MPNSKDNQMCWNCAYWQRYSPGDTPVGVHGECRKVPTLAFLYENDWFDSYEPFIPVGSIFWCSKWKLSPLTIPPIPATPVLITWPDVFWDWTAWNVKEPINQACVNCNHFQRDDPGNPQDLYGECRKLPPEPTTVSDIDGSSDIIPGIKYDFEGSEYWCGCWEELEE